MGIEVTGGGQRVLFEEKAASMRFRKTLWLPCLFLFVLSMVVELSVSVVCSRDTCELKRSTLFTSRVVSSFHRGEVVGLTCRDNDRLGDACRLKVILGQERDTVEVYNFKNGTRAFEVADALSHSLTDQKKGEVHFVHHGFLLGRFAESIDVPTRVAALCMALIVSFLCIGMVVPYKRLWVLEKGVLMGVDHYLHTTSLWNNSFWTLAKYTASMACKEVMRNNLTYAVYWIELEDSGVAAKIGEPSRFESELQGSLAILQREIAAARKRL